MPEGRGRRGRCRRGRDPRGVGRCSRGVAPSATDAAETAALQERIAALEREREDLWTWIFHLERLAQAGLMAGGLAHDTRNLLTGISGDSARRALVDDDPERHQARRSRARTTSRCRPPRRCRVFLRSRAAPAARGRLPPCSDAVSTTRCASCARAREVARRDRAPHLPRPPRRAASARCSSRRSSTSSSTPRRPSATRTAASTSPRAAAATACGSRSPTTARASPRPSAPALRAVRHQRPLRRRRPARPSAAPASASSSRAASSRATAARSTSRARPRVGTTFHACGSPPSPSPSPRRLPSDSERPRMTPPSPSVPAANPPMDATLVLDTRSPRARRSAPAGSASTTGGCSSTRRRRTSSCGSRRSQIAGRRAVALRPVPRRPTSPPAPGRVHVDAGDDAGGDADRRGQRDRRLRAALRPARVVLARVLERRRRARLRAFEP